MLDESKSVIDQEGLNDLQEFTLQNDVDKPIVELENNSEFKEFRSSVHSQITNSYMQNLNDNDRQLYSSVLSSQMQNLNQFYNSN